MRHPVSSLLLALLIGLAGVVSTGCKSDDGASGEEEPDRGPRPEVNLPPVPELNADRPMSHPDGSLTIWALTERRSDYLGQDVRVTGYAKRIYICETRDMQAAADTLIRDRLYLTEDEMAELEAAVVAAAGTGDGTGDSERCLYPHMYVADSMTSEREILVTGYGVPLEQRMRVGDQYVLEGRFLEETRGFNAAGRGLVYVFSVTGGNLDLPEGVAEGDGDGEEIQVQ